MHVQSNVGWLGGWLGGWLASRPDPPPPLGWRSSFVGPAWWVLCKLRPSLIRCQWKVVCPHLHKKAISSRNPFLRNVAGALRSFFQVVSG